MVSLFPRFFFWFYFFGLDAMELDSWAGRQNVDPGPMLDELSMNGLG